MRQVFSKIRDIWAAKDIRSKLIFTAFILLLYRLGSAIPVPFVNSSVMESFQSIYGGTVLDYLNVLSGSALSQATLFALSVSPYITAQIVLQLLTVAIDKLQRMSKEEDGKKKIAQYTRVLTIVLAVVTSFAYFQILKSNGWLTRTDFFAAIVIIACFTAGSSIIMWLGEKINESGIGNGISMILFANIVSGLPSMLATFVNNVFNTNYWTNLSFNNVLVLVCSILAPIVLIVMIFFIVFITNSERRIPIQYAKRVVGRKMYGGQNTNLPIKLNMTGVMPIIFASSIVSLPATIITLCGVTKNDEGFWATVLKIFDTSSILYIAIYMVLIVAFAYFYIMISFDPVEVSNNLKRNGGTVQGIRPGAPTADYIKKILNRVTLIGALFLIVIAGLPMILNAVAAIFDITSLSGLAFGGSSLLIVVGVALETYRDIEAQMSMRHYKGFLQ
ncbi:MAG: preprotein translocase subunit SecY [Clostridia bacterium]|nr:preprotein translocase subunit SecY [Clostridia bacterium]